MCTYYCMAGVDAFPNLLWCPYYLLQDSVLLLFEFLRVFIQLRAHWPRMPLGQDGDCVFPFFFLQAFIEFFHSYFVLLGFSLLSLSM